MSKQWLVIDEDYDEVHVVPLDDLIEHEDVDCICVPMVDPVERADGSVGYVYVHHSLDGREHNE